MSLYALRKIFKHDSTICILQMCKSQRKPPTLEIDKYLYGSS